jgi:protein-tyrosine phosphatase
VIDIHTHILPGVDDGVKTEDEAVEFARVAAADGVRTIVATPHCREGFYFIRRDEVLDHVARLRARLEGEGVEVELLPGAEVHLAPELAARVADGRAPTLGDNGRTLLLELSLSQYPVDVQNVLFQLGLAGLITVFAHPERVRYFQDDVRRYEELVRMGALGQITTGSITGRFGEATREFSEELLRKGLVHVIASDAHNVRGRPPRFREALQAAGECVGEAYAAAMVDDAPRALIEGRVPELPPLERPRQRSSFLSRWFSRRS